jgi:hypothetical protein
MYKKEAIIQTKTIFVKFTTTRENNVNFKGMNTSSGKKIGSHLVKPVVRAGFFN